jgi:hypothetical protein
MLSTLSSSRAFSRTYILSRSSGMSQVHDTPQCLNTPVFITLGSTLCRLLEVSSLASHDIVKTDSAKRHSTMLRHHEILTRSELYRKSCFVMVFAAWPPY